MAFYMFLIFLKPLIPVKVANIQNLSHSTIKRARNYYIQIRYIVRASPSVDTTYQLHSDLEET